RRFENMPTGESRRGAVLEEAFSDTAPAETASDRELLEQFTKRQDGAAFAILVQRHGPMVLGVCRRTLGEEPEAEAAFQAPFLVLVRGAAATRKSERLVTWLSGVASRMARKAGPRAPRRRRHEREATPMAA